jgi:hypothetical protein
MIRARMGLTPAEHVEVGSMLKRARRLLLDAAHTTRCYERLSRQLGDAANGLMPIRGELERKLIEQVGPEGSVEGVPVREVYFGQVKEEVCDG